MESNSFNIINANIISLDESSPNSAILPSGKNLRDAIENLLNEREISLEQFPSMGCNIKWK